MRRLTKGLFSALLALAFLARGAVALCPPKPADHGCCDTQAPSAPRTPCSEMSCCQIVPATAAPALGHFADFAAFVNVGGVAAAPEAASFLVPTFSDNGPPGPVAPSLRGRSPPILLG